jgi:hypothetical protein
MVHKLWIGQSAAIISDYGQVGHLVQEDTTCGLKLLPDDLGKVEKGFAFRVNFTQDHGDLVEHINSTILAFQKEGVARVPFLSSPNPVQTSSSSSTEYKYPQRHKTLHRSDHTTWQSMACIGTSSIMPTVCSGSES